MGTRARIGVKNADGTITSIYTHWDGYPGHHGPILLDHYATDDRARALVALGDASSLGPALETNGPHSYEKPQEGVTVFYGRDRGEKDVSARTHAANEWPDSGAEYHYLFDGKTWKYRQACNARTWKKLTGRSS